MAGTVNHTHHDGGERERKLNFLSLTDFPILSVKWVLAKPKEKKS